MIENGRLVLWAHTGVGRYSSQRHCGKGKPIKGEFPAKVDPRSFFSGPSGPHWLPAALLGVTGTEA